MRITREQVIEAIRTEPLHYSHFGQWVLDDGEGNACTVCAVGGVLRQVCELKKTEDIIDAADRIVNLPSRSIHGVSAPCTSRDVIPYHLQQGNFLAALSCEFETLVREEGQVTPGVRKTLIKWVKKNLPEQFDVDLGKFEPKKAEPLTFAEIMQQAGLVSPPPVNVIETVKKEMDERVAEALKEEVPA